MLLFPPRVRYAHDVEGQTVKYSSCQCPIGRDKCHHMAAVLIWVEKNVSRTDVECAWKRAKTPSTDQIAAKRVSEMTPSTTQAGIKRPVTQEDKDWVQATLSQLGRLTGIGWILSPETPLDSCVRHVIGEFSMSQEQSSSIRRALVWWWRAVCSFRTVACSVDLQMGQCLTTALWK
ncbi:unnamed protein product [Boreogadus saida]